jgi:acyl-CoA thioester hydrolase
MEEIKEFKHKTSFNVHFAHVDLAGVVHNVQYFYYFEHARTTYFRDLGFKLNNKTFIFDLPLMVVHNEIDYLSPAAFGDTIDVYTRVMAIGDKSLTFENVAVANGKIIAKGKCVHVHLSKDDLKPCAVPDSIRSVFEKFENRKF